VGEALVSFLDERGIPSIVEKARIVPPQSQIGPILPEERNQMIRSSVIYGVYEKQVDRESAFEILQKKFDREDAEEKAAADQKEMMKQQKQQKPVPGSAGDIFGDMAKMAGRSLSRQFGNEIGRTLVRVVLGSFLAGAFGSTRKR